MVVFEATKLFSAIDDANAAAQPERSVRTPKPDEWRIKVRNQSQKPAWFVATESKRLEITKN